MNEGLVVVFVPVAGPRGSYGIGVLQLEAKACPHPLGLNCPAIKAAVGLRSGSIRWGAQCCPRIMPHLSLNPDGWSAALCAVRLAPVSFRR
jgi:hypothetical protein